MRLSSFTLSRFGAIAIAAIFCVAAPAHAHGGHRHGTFPGSVTINGSAIGTVSGACTAGGIADGCADGHCKCVTVSAQVSGGLQGPMTLYATVDKGEENPATPCRPVYVTMLGTLSVKNGGSGEVSGDAFLVECAGQVRDGDLGMKTADGNATVVATLKGTVDETTGTVALKATGTLSVR